MHIEEIDEKLKPYPDILTPSQVAEIYGVEVQQVQRWAKQSRIAYIRTPGGHRRFLKKDILDAIRSGYSGVIRPTDERFL